ncbi:MAG: hypothetical protein JKY56_09340 [Kofleriaceae bacterium]|nr:hypothetical protein [Kofleriaceae bacterium]
MRKSQFWRLPQTLTGALLLLGCKSTSAPPSTIDTPRQNGEREVTLKLPSGDKKDGPSDNAAFRATCSRVTEDGCNAGLAQQATQTPDPNNSLSTNGKDIFYNGQEYDFDAPSFRYATVDCLGHGDAFAWDKNDVYLLAPQSCGPQSCGGNYTGYYWAPMGVKDPSAFRWLAWGYAIDGHYVYNQWRGRLKVTESLSKFEILACGEHGVFGSDGVNWFQDERRTTSEEIRSKLRKQRSAGG